VLRHLSSPREALATSLARLDRHFALHLDCEPAALRRPGVTIVATRRRDQPEWGGWLMPFYGLAPDASETCLLSCQPSLEPALHEALAALPPGVRPLNPSWLAAVRAAAVTPGATWSERMVYVADAAAFRPHGIDPSLKIERWAPGARPDTWLSRAFDGPCFVIRDGAGQIAAWAGIKRKSDLAHEIAAATEPAYRGRGLATALTAHATAAILEEGRLALWIAEVDNLPSRRLVERLGFGFYGRQSVTSRFDPSATEK
jgi:ribosomal protein S18 acetylase RimI-like enzyme